MSMSSENTKNDNQIKALLKEVAPAPESKASLK